MTEITTLLNAVRDGQADAANRLFEVLYRDLREIAHGQLRKQGDGGMLDTTSLVHESYLRFLNSGGIKPDDRRYFLAYAANVMRSIIVDFARRQIAGKRGGGQLQVTLNTGIAQSVIASDTEIVRLHEAIEELATIDGALASLVELRYFGGLSEVEAAEALGISRRTVQRNWEKARLFLHEVLKE